MSTLTKAQQAQQQEARDELRKMFPPGTTVPTILRHVSASGMSRAISVIDPADLGDVSYLVARALGDRIDPRHGGVKVPGCGMDMGFHLVYSLSAVLYGDGWTCTGSRCPSNVHVNERTPRDGNAEHTDGYALSHRWL